MVEKMTQRIRFGKLYAATMVATLLIACDNHPTSVIRPNMTALSPRLQEIFIDSKTLCFGQFILDIPASATVIFGHTSIDATIQYFPDEGDRINDHINSQLIEIEKDRKYLSKDDIVKFPLFGKVIDGENPGHRMVFGSNERVAYSIYSFIPLGKDLYIQTYNTAISKDDTISLLSKVARSLRPRDTDEIPDDTGTCIDGGFVAYQPEYENLALGIRLKEFPDVHFSVEVVRNGDDIPEASDLEARLKAAEGEGGGWYSRVEFIRRAPRQIGEWKGAEALARKPAQEMEKESHEFHFISMGAPNDSFRPRLAMQLDTGAGERIKGAVKPSLSNEEAVALWDKLTSSIRVRPRSVRASEKASDRRVPLQTNSVTGALCPATGWWECAYLESVDGGKRRHFTEGEPLPYIVVRGNPNLWQKLTGEVPTLKITTVWKLIGYESADKAAL